MTTGPSIHGTATRRTLSATVAVLVAVAAAGRFGPPGTMLLAGPLGAAVLLALARAAGLDAGDVGIGRRSWRRGAAYALVCVSAVAAVYAVAALLPATRPAFLDTRYRNGLGPAVTGALVVVPLGTVLFEEIAFRGVLWALLCRRTGAARATLVSSGLFGLWHVLPSLRLNRVNPAVAQIAGSGRIGQLLAVAGAVVFTTAAGAVLCELRRRSGSLLAPAGLHWAVNGLAILTAAGVVSWWEGTVPR
ncbi:CPBP family intramembrane glutamic endopeptidase [Couchioplanes caeruleus]|uniref:CPBP family intramembrane glutamic endopeptidase n=1 Tax=Couchioplanes caeruleus TaxID=56438 RepID=UPI000AEF95CE|nr:CPBP family intramembrane glutamic endopeptidase [Couchioplanes caeruleus]